MSRFYLIIIFAFLNFHLFSQDFTQEYFKHAQQQKKNGDYVEALVYLEKILAKDSNKVEYLWEYAETLRLYKDYKNAERIYHKVYEKEETKLFLYSLFQLAEMQKMNGKYNEAIESFKLAKKKYAFDKKDYLYLKSTRELEACLWAKKASKDLSDFKLLTLPEKINSKNSEFGHTISDNVFYFSSLKGDSVSDKEEVISTSYKTGLFTSKISELNKINPLQKLNSSDFHIGNGTFSIDRKRFYYSACKEINNELICKILVAKLEGNEIVSVDTLDELINEVGANTSMPHIASFDNSEVLFFSSNREGSIGGLDIFYSYIKNQGEEYSKPIAVEQINTLDNELSPFYDKIENKLYFSSSWWDGFGGYDVFYSSFLNYKFQKPINLGLPINSSVNDLYFFKHETESYFSSNRIGSNFAKNPTCCSDIYYVSSKKEEELWSENNQNSQNQNNTASINLKVNPKYRTLEELNNKLPVTLYFHNDIPNPKSIDTNTNLNYLTTYHDYSNMLSTYKKEYSKGLLNEDAKDAEEDIESFFIEFVHQGVKDLEIFSELLLKELKVGNSIVLTVKGFASPLAKSDYNVNLTKRRIASLKNYLREYNKGVFLPYLNQNAENQTQLVISEIPFGEYVANKLVSDNPNDAKNSIYSRAAGLERKIEIQTISYNLKDTNNFLIAKTQLIDLGDISENTVYSKKFEIKNVGPKETEIDRFEIPCACNTVKNTKQKLTTNENDFIEITLDPKGYKGKIVKSVYIYTKNSKTPLRLVLTGNVK